MKGPEPLHNSGGHRPVGQELLTGRKLASQREALQGKQWKERERESVERARDNVCVCVCAGGGGGGGVEEKGVDS